MNYYKKNKNNNKVANLIVFLLFNKSKYIHSQNLVIDDGWSL